MKKSNVSTTILSIVLCGLLCVTVLYRVSVYNSEIVHEEVPDQEISEPFQDLEFYDYLCEELLDGMILSCIQGDYDLGTYYELLRNELIFEHKLDYKCISYEDLYYTSKIIYFESGSSWMSDELQCLVGSVLYNRSVSPEFPDTIKECVYQEGQYSPTKLVRFESTNPEERNVRNALKVLTGEYTIPETVVFQANFKQGSGVYKEVYDSKLKTTSYFCYTSNLELYE